MQRQKKEVKEREKKLITFFLILNLNYLNKFFWREEYQIDLNLYFVPIFNGEFGKHISILTIILRNALLYAKKM